MKCMFVTFLCCLAVGPYAVAIEKPPLAPHTRSWLEKPVRQDMEQTNKGMREKLRATEDIFGTKDFRPVKALTNQQASPNNKVCDDDVALLADYYSCTRRVPSRTCGSSNFNWRSPRWHNPTHWFQIHKATP